jgi:hypothetical protein
MVRIRDRQANAVEVKDAHVRSPQVVHGLASDQPDEREGLVEIAKRQLEDQRLTDAAPAGVRALAPLGRCDGQLSGRLDFNAPRLC